MNRLDLIRYVRISDLSRALNRSHSTIYEWVNDLAIQRIKGKILTEDLDKIIKNRL